MYAFIFIFVCPRPANCQFQSKIFCFSFCITNHLCYLCNLHYCNKQEMTEKTTKTENITSGKRIAKNTLLLYVRMIFVMAVSLYTSRMVLDALGASDFGIYNVTGGLVTMFAFIGGTLATATQRFLSFEIGRGDKGNVGSVFSTAVVIHTALAAVVFLLGETVGLWFLNTYMNFPPDRLSAANWVFQLSLATFVIDVASVPYNAAIIAYERMKAFAYVGIIDVLARLGVVIAIIHSSCDRLVLYAALLAMIAVMLRVVYGVYCGRNFPDCRCSWRFDKATAGSMGAFVSWNLIGAVAGVGKEQGINVLLNIFFGATVNAARGVAYQVMNSISGFVSNFQMAMNPQIIKSYAAGDRKDMYMLVFRGSKYSFLLLLFLSLPVILEAPFVLGVWLKQVPDFTVVFLRIVLLTTLVDSLSNTMITVMHASGRVRDYQIVVGGISLLALPVAYVLFKQGFPPQSAMCVSLALAVVCHFARLLLLRHTVDFPVFPYINRVTLRCLLTSVAAAIIPYLVFSTMSEGWQRFICVGFSSVFSVVACGYVLALEGEERNFVMDKARKMLRRKER